MHPPVCLLTLLAFPGSTHCTYTHSGLARLSLLGRLVTYQDGLLATRQAMHDQQSQQII